MTPSVAAGQVLRASLQRAGDRPLVIRPDGSARTGRELDDRIEGLARLLAAKGLAGRRIGAWYQNSFAVLEAHLAIERIGATRVPVDPGAAPKEAMQVFDAAGAELVLADESHAAGLGGDVIVHSDERPAAAGGSLDAVEVPPDRVLHLFPRGVANGKLHGVPVTYGNWEALMRVQEGLYRGGDYGPPLQDDDVFLTAQQAMHGTSMIGTYPFLRMGLPQVILERFDAEVALEAIRRHSVTSTMFVPEMVTRLADAVRRAQSPELPVRRLFYGGAPIERAKLLDAIAVFDETLVQLYGRWEGGWPISILSGADHRQILHDDSPIAASCGRPIEAVEVKLRPAPGAAEGARELCVRSPMVVAEYADPDGWYPLGDIARLDESGYLYLVGRLDGQISTGSYHVYPGEIEEALLSQVSVLDARVVGEPDPQWGQAVTAYVVQHPDETPADAEELRLALRLHLAAYKVPKRIHFVDALPAA